ncbi:MULTISPECIES: hypothetical protein [Curtobacterium]|uniref:hypothetical protein n=1 Tax=Curtobacterium TaxID=2034 RepID=UPI0015F3981F|nr:MULTISPECIES: hypothetical protein [Curtobacterium]MCS6562348.1 hypothetical protein [Curtobacterium flaccumfaciens pv. poinsettiae]UXN28412.1 hypothetical protein N8D75_15655 [Curtobacterium flaccumfaciens]
MPVLLPVLFLFAGGLWFLIGMFVSPRDMSLLGRAIGAVFYAGAMTAFFGVWISRARRRAGGTTQLTDVQRGLKRGEVPEDADPATWTATVDEHHRQLRRSLWFGPVVFGVMIVLALWLALTSTPWWWFGVAFFVGFLLFSVITTPRALAKAEVVREELSRRATGR